MTKAGGAEKKRVRKSGSVQNGTRDPNSDSPPKKQASEKDVFQLFAEKVRDHKGLESRWAVLQETRVEYFRGKDFVSFLKNHPDVKDVLESSRNSEVGEIADALLRQNLLVRCDRVVKTVRPGKEKAVHLACTSGDFPFRSAIFGAVYVVLGKRIWFFPNILAEEATLKELFWFWPKKDEEQRPRWTKRVFYAALAVLVILLLRHHAPDEAARARYQKRVSNIIDDVLEWSPRLALSRMMEKQPTPDNVTESSNTSADGSNMDTEKVPPSDNAGIESSLGQRDDEVLENTTHGDRQRGQDHV